MRLFVRLGVTFLWAFVGAALLAYFTIKVFAHAFGAYDYLAVPAAVLIVFAWFSAGRIVQERGDK